jgi:prepilin-type N-terminal cleavage/methylation domain-containing protein
LHVINIYCRGLLNRLKSFRVKTLDFKGFTLAELLIALVVLGLVVTFTIPKMLTVVGNNQKYAVFKEMISTYETVGYELSLQKVSNGNQFVSALGTSKLNAIKQTNFGPSNILLTFANGAESNMSFNSGCGAGLAVITIDYNGFSNGSNIAGDDIFCGRMILGNSGGCMGSDFRGPSPPGRLYVSANCGPINPLTGVGVGWSYSWPGQTMYQSIFTNAY